MANGIFFNNRVTRRPGAYSRIDRSGLEAPGLADAGVVALLGTAEGGVPVTAMEGPAELLRLRSPAQARAALRDGDLLDAVELAFAPSNDPAIAGGAAEVVIVKVNSATQSSAELENDEGAVIDLTSRDYGAFTEQVQVSLQAATGGETGFLLSVRFEDTIEQVNGLGGDPLATLSFAPGDDGYDAGVAAVSGSGQVTATMSRTEAGRDAHALNAWGGALVARGVATAADAGKILTVYGVSGGQFVREELTLVDGTVLGSVVFTDVVGASLDAAAVANISVFDGTDNRFTFTAGMRERGGVLCGAGMFVQNLPVSVAIDSTAADDVVVFGRNQAGTQIAEAITMSGSANDPVDGALNFAQIDFISLVESDAGDEITLSAIAGRSTPAVHSSLQKVADFFNAKAVDVDGDLVGFEWENLTGATNTAVTELDEGTTGDIVAAPGEFTADVFAIINWLNINSQFVEAALSTGATRTAPNTSVAPIFLSGGSEGSAPFSQWQAGLDMLKQTRVNTIVPLTGLSAVHAAVAAHCEYMATVGKYECDALVGLVDVDDDGVPVSSPPTAAPKADLQAQIRDLNSRHVRACAQFVGRFNRAGEREVFPPWFLAVIGAGMQAGSPIGEPLTNKFINALSLSQHSSWNPNVDAEEMLQSGLFFAEPIEGIGFRVVRNLTTVLSSDNLSLTEASVNEAVNFAVLSLRSRLEDTVGQRGFAPTLAVAKALATGVLDLLVANGIIVAWRSLQMELVLDRLEVSVELAPVLPINFVPITVHLVTVPLTA